ncbi:hypothetical protein KP806_07545 [Paenibacillus sp. N4]|uniref:hypothetical protein n=1 Tax=Paenibacillus vietnamensis TaxID=2590547 RepID=UPI001CD15F8E|nr:hypothetical protein [Paenibacillus vietnamensis]MCA0754900.1 hypothetical protein [Paenibacillus vietnamensis]
MAWIAPKLDWTSDDSINAEDWNRIENNTAEVVIYLNSIQYAMPVLTTITNRTQAHVDYLSSINRIEQNLEAIRSAFMTPVGYPGAVTWVSGKPFTPEDAIRLEQNVMMLLETGFLVYESFRYCGATTCGEGWTV